jgi:hypothetical protein
MLNNILLHEFCLLGYPFKVTDVSEVDVSILRGEAKQEISMKQAETCKPF